MLKGGIAMYYILFFLLTFFSVYGAVRFTKIIYCSLLGRLSKKERDVRIWTPK